MTAHGFTELDRFTSKYVVDDETGCWVWTAAVTKTTGYGKFMRLGGRMQNAHRTSYELHVGQIPAGLVIDHLCSNRRCVNPEHLDAVTQRENLLRSPHTLASAHLAGRPCGFVGCHNGICMRHMATASP